MLLYFINIFILKTLDISIFSLDFVCICNVSSFHIRHNISKKAWKYKV